MNRTLNTQERLEARFALKVAAGLREAAEQTPHDINERLKVARLQALAARKQPELQTQAANSVNVSRSGGAATASMGSGGGTSGNGWASKLVYLLPALALAIGIFAVMNNNTVQQPDFSALAEIDAEVLADELPPVAFLESGFAAFAKNDIKVD
jgi:Protein of unknown function (DUF3619)